MSKCQKRVYVPRVRSVYGQHLSAQKPWCPHVSNQRVPHAEQAFGQCLLEVPRAAATLDTLEPMGQEMGWCCSRHNSLAHQKAADGAPGMLVHHWGSHDGDQGLWQQCAHVLVAVWLWVSVDEWQQREQQFQPDPHGCLHPLWAAYISHVSALHRQACRSNRRVSLSRLQSSLFCLKQQEASMRNSLTYGLPANANVALHAPGPASAKPTRCNCAA